MYGRAKGRGVSRYSSSWTPEAQALERWIDVVNQALRAWALASLRDP